MIRKIAKKAIGPLLVPYLNPLVVPFRPGNVIMFHIGRCGSTVVADLLNQHPRIHWASEFYSSIFHDWQRINGGIERVGEMADDAVELLQRNMQFALHRYYGFEIKPFHFRLIGYSPDSFLHHADSLGFTHFILLDRKNRLRTMISSIIAHQNEALYHIDSNTKAQLTRVTINVNEVKVDFDVKPLLAYLSDYDGDIDALKTLLESRNSLHLTYEQDIQMDPRRAYHRICDFLALQPVDVSIKYARTNPFPICDMIENIEEVRQALHGTPYEWMLDD